MSELPPSDDHARRLGDALRAAGGRAPVPPADAGALGAAVRRRRRERRGAAGFTAALILVGGGIAAAALAGPGGHDSVATNVPAASSGTSGGSGSSVASGASGPSGGSGPSGSAGVAGGSSGSTPATSGTSGRVFTTHPAAGVTGGAAAAWALVVSGTTSSGTPSAASLVAVDPAAGSTEGERVTLPDGGGSLVAVAPDGERAYVVEEPTDGSGPAELVPVALAAVKAGAPITIKAAAGMTPYITSMAFSPDGRTAYLTDAVGGSLISVDLQTGEQTARIPVANMAACGDAVTHTAVTPDGKDVYIEGLGNFYDVALGTGKSSSAFQVKGFAPNTTLYGDPTMALAPDGQTLWALQSGESHDLLTPISTNGDNAGTTMSVAVPAQSPGATSGVDGRPLWDGLVVTGPSTAYVIAYGAHPEAIVPVDLSTGAAGQPIPVTTASAASGCGDQPPVPVAFTPDGTQALVGDAGSPAVHVVDLSTGQVGPAIVVANTGRGATAWRWPPGSDPTVAGILTTASSSDWVWPIG